MTKGYYYDHIDTEMLAKLIVQAGRAGHQLRNHAHSLYNFGYPEIITVDQYAGEVQGYCRYIRAQIQNKIDIKYALRDAVKMTVFLKTIITGKLPEYIHDTDKYSFTEIGKMIDLMIQSFKEADQRVNQAILKDSQVCFSDKELQTLKIEMPDTGLIQKLESEFKVENSNALKLEGKENYETFKRINMKLGRLICNKAHQIQDLASVYGQQKPQNQFSKQIINVAGQIENQSREVQRKLLSFGRVNSKQMALHRGVGHHCEQISQRIETLEKISSNPGCPLKLSGEGPFEVLLQMEIGLWRILKTNNEKGFVMAF